MKSSTIKTSSFLFNKVAPKSLSRNILFRVFEKIEIGQLVIEEGNGEKFFFGNQTSKPEISAKVQISNPLSYSWMLRKGDLGAAEAYIQGYWQTTDILSVIQLFARNSNVLSGINENQSFLSKLIGNGLHLFNKNSLSGSRKNIAAHYDLSNDFFSLFLDPTMAYSSGIFTAPEDDLEKSSLNKFKHICQNLQLSEQDHLLEIGTGWGGLAIYAAKNFGCRVTTTTISEQQYKLARIKIKEQGLEDKITLLKKDYRLLSGKYSKLVSVEMIEAVGSQYYSNFFNCCNNLLKDDGLMLIQAITISDQRYHQSLKTTDFIKKYIFPGGQLPSNQAITKHLCKDTDMQLINLDDLTMDYAKTLACWRHNFLHHLDEIKALGYDQRFIRMWLYYFSFCEGGFRERLIHTSQFLCAKPQFRKLKPIPILSHNQHKEVM